LQKLTKNFSFASKLQSALEKTTRLKLKTMIQRIQTLFLLLAAVFTALTFAFPFASFMHEGIKVVQLNAFSLSLVEPAQGYDIGTNVFAIGTLSAIITVLCTFTIMLFSNRVLQIRFTTYTLILIVLHIIAIASYIFIIASKDELDFAPEFGVISQIVSLILVFLALKRIKKDEALIRSVDRIR